MILILGRGIISFTGLSIVMNGNDLRDTIKELLKKMEWEEWEGRGRNIVLIYYLFTKVSA